MVSNDEVSRFRDNLSLIRRSIGWSAEEFGKKVEISRQSINNLENGKFMLSKPHYVAMRYVLNEEIENSPKEETEMLRTVLDVFVDNPDNPEYTKEVKEDIKKKVMLFSPALETKVATKKEVSDVWKKVLTATALGVVTTIAASVFLGVWINKK